MAEGLERMVEMSEYIERIIEFVPDSQADNMFSTCPELVRCCDCKHYDDYLGTCLRPRHNFAAEPNGFCSWGVRK